MRKNQNTLKHTGTASQPATVTYPTPGTNNRYRLTQILGSYSDLTALGTLTVVADPAGTPVTLLEVDGQAFDIRVPSGLQTPAGAAIAVTLAGVTGEIAKLTVVAELEQ